MNHNHHQPSITIFVTETNDCLGNHGAPGNPLIRRFWQRLLWRCYQAKDPLVIAVDDHFCEPMVAYKNLMFDHHSIAGWTVRIWIAPVVKLPVATSHRQRVMGTHGDQCSTVIHRSVVPGQIRATMDVRQGGIPRCVLLALLVLALEPFGASLCVRDARIDTGICKMII